MALCDPIAGHTLSKKILNKSPSAHLNFPNPEIDSKAQKRH
jgi:hypothetical protein